MIEIKDLFLHLNFDAAFGFLDGRSAFKFYCPELKSQLFYFSQLLIAVYLGSFFIR